MAQWLHAAHWPAHNLNIAASIAIPSHLIELSVKPLKQYPFPFPLVVLSTSTHGRPWYLVFHAQDLLLLLLMLILAVDSFCSCQTVSIIKLL